mmetsp:Transcript_26952/g.58893  ORF Transcript_26952/g.58893 Transcript_26952/m.58893 type:complete len:552 (-) Transcript_26952:2237-3892(-)
MCKTTAVNSRRDMPGSAGSFLAFSDLMENDGLIQPPLTCQGAQTPGPHQPAPPHGASPLRHGRPHSAKTVTVRTNTPCSNAQLPELGLNCAEVDTKPHLHNSCLSGPCSSRAQAVPSDSQYQGQYSQQPLSGSPALTSHTSPCQSQSSALAASAVRTAYAELCDTADTLPGSYSQHTTTSRQQTAAAPDLWEQFFADLNGLDQAPGSTAHAKDATVHSKLGSWERVPRAMYSKPPCEPAKGCKTRSTMFRRCASAGLSCSSGDHMLKVAAALQEWCLVLRDTSASVQGMEGRQLPDAQHRPTTAGVAALPLHGDVLPYGSCIASDSSMARRAAVTARLQQHLDAAAARKQARQQAAQWHGQARSFRARLSRFGMEAGSSSVVSRISNSSSSSTVSTGTCVSGSSSGSGWRSTVSTSSSSLERKTLSRSGSYESYGSSRSHSSSGSSSVRGDAAGGVPERKSLERFSSIRSSRSLHQGQGQLCLPLLDLILLGDSAAAGEARSIVVEERQHASASVLGPWPMPRQAPSLHDFARTPPECVPQDVVEQLGKSD